ncbi:Type II/IV secretion system protein [Acididesulfobacillus acetoxydans]|uniref:Type II secretion system protein E n=1 Tax=Acididesulfobacillus acetoxydans TaxID=1561005 RepID=A0A8S0VX44_9FIRM|nr:type II/IV secretion system protein [Acididesulfobacillus acetoxydans]CAA7601563.1 Type II/IV secretion system protein [Acididesulfobacillus acetoxydans]CEJ07050.1 Type II secretion system protein E [Acididesulfobacillus acetoxydans]
MALRQERKRLGEILIAGGVISPAQLNEALQTQKMLGLRLGEVLIRQGLATEDDILHTMRSQLGLDLIDLNQRVVPEKVLRQLPERVVRKYGVLPLDDSGGILRVAMNDPTDYFAVEDIRLAAGMPVRPCLARRDDIQRAVDRYYSRNDAEKAAREYARHLLSQGLVSEEDILRAMQSQLGLEMVDLAGIFIPEDVLRLVPESLARRYTILPVEVRNGQLLLALNDPTDYHVLEEVRQASALPIKPCLARKSEIAAAIERSYGKNEAQRLARDYLRQGPASQVAASSQAGAAVVPGWAAEGEDAASTPIIKFLNTLIEDAINNQASDIHIEPLEEELRIRFRVDGVLREIMRTPIGMVGPVVSRVKIMSGLNIAERRLPQDGRIGYQVAGRNIDLRVSTAPTMFGEKVVLRVLDKANIVVGKDALGLSGAEVRLFDEFISKPYGIVLVTGPTGSGKTTTLYTMLGQLNTPEKNVITLEDPVEFKFKGINQMQVNPKAGFTFAAGLRSVLRQDPDVIMVGEMRDRETAEIAVRSALTGHLVLSTIHTNDAASAVTRLEDMGVEPFLISASLVGIISQRLVRQICPQCTVEYAAGPLERGILGAAEGQRLLLKRGKGCPFCGGSGYKGRTAIFEIMPIGEEHRRLITDRASLDALRACAAEQGMVSLKQAAARLVLSGLTTMEELLRVTYVNE